MFWSDHPRTATQWFVRLRETPVTRKLSDGFTRWLRLDAANERAYEQREAVWELAGDLQGRASLAALLREAEGRLVARGRDPHAVPISQPLRWPRLVMPLSAGALALLAGIVVLMLRDPPTVADYQTARGVQQTVQLSDGSSIVLNSDTHLIVRYSRRHREVDMERGEALFSVAKDPHRPFEVHALRGVTTAVGTQFAVRVDERRAEVTVLEGVVRVNTSTLPDANQGIRVGASQAIDYSSAGDLSALRTGNVLRIEAWQQQRIVFENTTLTDALAEYNRYTDTPLVLKSTRLGDKRVQGVFRIGDEPSFVHALEQALPLRAVPADDSIELLDRH
jgi:transmembrane sensor